MPEKPITETFEFETMEEFVWKIIDMDFFSNQNQVISNTFGYRSKNINTLLLLKRVLSHSEELNSQNWKKIKARIDQLADFGPFLGKNVYQQLMQEKQMESFMEWHRGF